MKVKNTRLEPSDLKKLASVSQALDNQYVPKKLLKTGRSLGDLRKILEKEVRAEYLRSILYSEQVVINRAYLFNNPTIFNDFVEGSENRETIFRFLNNQVMVPWLYQEKTLEEKPAFSVDPDGWQAVKGLVNEVDIIPYLRLSWDDHENVKILNKLARVYTNFVMTMRITAEHIARDLAIKDVAGFQKRLTEVTKFCLDTFDETGREIVTRDQLYKEFVCVDGTPSAEGIYDPGKPFSYELKMLFDLKYNVNLPDSLGIQTFTGRDLPDRSALHEVDMALADIGGEGVAIDLPALFSEVVLDMVQEGLWLKSISHLNLSDVEKARSTGEWRNFIQAATNLNETATKAVDKGESNPLGFKAYFEAFNGYQEALAKIAEKRYRENMQPTVEIIIKVGSVILSLSPITNAVKIAGVVSSLDNKVESLAIKVIARNKREWDLALSLDFMKEKLADPRTQVEKLLEKIRSSGYEIQEDPKTSGQTDVGTLEKPLLAGHEI